LFSKLRKKALVTSVRGPGGGYRLSRSTDDVFVAQIVDAVNESVDATGCKGRSDCQSGNTCLTHHLWCDLSDQIHDFLSQISLEQLVHRNEVRQVAERQDLESRKVGFERSKIIAAIVD
jgi:Rrf2 family iron-sulfur cluster assembly transcriptional regulator